jgi:hypothetical protein
MISGGVAASRKEFWLGEENVNGTSASVALIKCRADLHEHKAANGKGSGGATSSKAGEELESGDVEMPVEEPGWEEVEMPGEVIELFGGDSGVVEEKLELASEELEGWVEVAKQEFKRTV